jgi:anti-anti-sigma factor
LDPVEGGCEVACSSEAKASQSAGGLDVDILEDLTGGVTTVALTGRLDATSAAALQARLLGLIDAGIHRLIVDLSQLDYISSVGLRVFLIAAKRLSPLGGRMVLCAVRPQVRNVFTIAGFDRLFGMFETREDAARALDRQGP